MKQQSLKSRPLDGTTVLELGHIAAGPTAGMIAAWLGAQVIKVEPPGRGDQSRKPRDSGAGTFVYLNRGKQSVAIDLATSDGQRALHRLVTKSDVVISNFGNGVVERLGAAYEELRRWNPALVYVQIQGYLTEEYANRPALDEVAQMMSGLAYMTGPAGRPLRAGASVVDMTAAMFAAIAVCSTLPVARKTGDGEYIQVGLYESSLFYMGQAMANFQLSGRPSIPYPEREGGAHRMYGWGIYDVFVAQGDEPVFVGITSDKHWKAFCEEFGLHDLKDDPRYASNLDRLRERPRLLPRLQETFRRYDAGAIADRLSTRGIPFAPVRSPDDVIYDGATTKGFARSRFEGEEVLLPDIPISAAWTAARRTRAVDIPRLGEHTRTILEASGLASEEIEALLAGCDVGAE